MTRDDILRMVMESCDPNTEPAWHNGFWTLTQEELERFAALVAAAEREACEEVCENNYWVAESCIRDIRARGEKE